MAVSSDQDAAKETLEVIKWCSENGFNSVLGVSNSSFGLPERKFINSAFLVMAMANGLKLRYNEPQRRADDGYVPRSRSAYGQRRRV